MIEHSVMKQIQDNKHFIPPEQSEGEVSNMAWRPLSVHPSVTSSHTIEARGLKFGMHNSCIDGFKVIYQFFWYFA